MASMENTEQKTHKENNPQMNFQNINSSEHNYSNSSELKSVTLAYTNPNFTSPSFSKLLEGVVMAANSSLSHDPLVKTVGFEGKFEMSHQEALANVTAKATQNRNSCHSDEPPGDVPRTPKSDGYNWRKYGQKQVKGSRSSRSYYRCTSFLCRAKKTVQHLDLSGEVIDVVYKGDHNHDPPPNPRGTSRKKDSTPRAVHNSSDSFVKDLNVHHSLASEGEIEQSVISTYECQNKNVIGEAGTSPKDVEEQHRKTVDAVSRSESELAIVPVVEECSSPRSENPTEVAIIDPIKVLDVAPVKKRRIKERGKACSESVYRTFKDPKVVVLADADVGMSSDGYRWRKYGQKMVKGTPHPRSYYRCSSVGCPVRKHVERATDNSATILVTYEGEHDHEIPTPKRHPQISSPNAMASDANTVSEKSENKSPSAEEQSKDSDSNPGEDQKGSDAGGDKVLESARTLLSIGIELKSC